MLEGRERVDRVGAGRRPDLESVVGLASEVRKAASKDDRVMVTGNSRRMLLGVV